jgi:hypothetical protein
MQTATPFAECAGAEMAAKMEENAGGPGPWGRLGAWGEAGTPLLSRKSVSAI